MLLTLRLCRVQTIRQHVNNLLTARTRHPGEGFTHSIGARLLDLESAVDGGSSLISVVDDVLEFEGRGYPRSLLTGRLFLSLFRLTVRNLSAAPEENDLRRGLNRKRRAHETLALETRVAFHDEQHNNFVFPEFRQSRSLLFFSTRTAQARAHHCNGKGHLGAGPGSMLIILLLMIHDYFLIVLNHSHHCVAQQNILLARAKTELYKAQALGIIPADEKAVLLRQREANLQARHLASLPPPQPPPAVELAPCCTICLETGRMDAVPTTHDTS